MVWKNRLIYGEAMMKLLDLVIVDDEPILLKGLLKTYDWDQMGFQVVGTALSGEQAIEVIREKKPDVVLTDIRMKQMTGLQMMDTIQQTGQECLFVVLSAYRDFEYAKEAEKRRAHGKLGEAGNEGCDKLPAGHCAEVSV